jgi:hypothetical protein
METSTVFWTIAIVLAIFGVLFLAVGMASERSYWMQRDPSGDAARQATKLSVITRHAGRLATGDIRAPLRIAAIGVILIVLAIVAGVIALFTAA